MKKFNSLFYTGLTIILSPVVIFTIVAFASMNKKEIIQPVVKEVVVVEVKPKVHVDTIPDPEPVKPVKKKKIEVVDSIQPVIHLDSLIQKDTLH
jgi:hypothetical protein